MCGGTTVSAPAPDPAQQQLEQMQLDDLKQSRTDIEQFKPFVLQQYGLQEVQGDNPAYGNITHRLNELSNGTPEAYAGEKASLLKQMATTPAVITTGYTKTPEQQAKDTQLAALQDQTLQLQKTQQQRIQDALDGKIPPSQALEQQKAKDFAVLQQDQGNRGNEIVGDSLDNAVAKTTTGQQQLESLKKTYGSLEQGETNAIIQGEANLPGVYQSQYSAGNTLQNPGAPPISSGVAGLSPLYTSAYQPYQYQQGLQYQAGSTNATNQTNMLTGLISAGVKGGTTIATAFA